MMANKTFLTVFNEKKRFPVTGKGFVVQRVKQPTMQKGSQVLWTKRFKTMKEANAFANKRKSLGRKLSRIKRR